MSSSIQALRERLAALNRKMNALLADKGSQTWTKEDQATFDADGDEAERLQQQIAAHQKMLDREAEQSFSDVKPTAKGEKPKSEAVKAFETYLRKSFAQMTHEERQSVNNTMSTTTGSQGGFTVQTDIARELVDLLKSYGWMRKVAAQITTEQGNPMSYPTSDGTSETGEWIAQNGTATGLDPSFGTVPVNVFKASSKIIAVPIELLQDSAIDVQAMVLKRIRDRVGRTMNIGFTNGGGTTDPNGLVTAAGTGKVGATGQTLTIVYDDLVDMVDSLDAAYLDNPDSSPAMPNIDPGWMFSQTMRRVIRKIKDTSGRPIWMPSYEEGLTGGTPDRLMGYPVYINNDMPVPAASAKSLAFGNFHRYLIRDAMDVTIFRFDDSVYISKGQIGFLAWARAGGNLLDTNAVKLYQHSAT